MPRPLKRAAVPAPAPAADTPEELLTTRDLAVLYRTTDVAIRTAMAQRKPWLPPVYKLGSRTFFVRSEAMAALRRVEVPA